MPEPFDISRLELEASSEVLGLLRACPDIDTCRYRDGEFLVRQNEDSMDVFLVLAGAIVVEQTSGAPGATPTILATVMCNLEKPAIVGEMAYLGTQRRSASVRSSGATHALRLKPAHVDAVIEGFPGLTRAICAQFSWRLKETSRALGELQSRFSLKAAHRLANPGEVLFSKGESATTLFQLVSGAVMVEREGREDILHPEDLPQGFLESEPYLRNRAHTATATVHSHAFLVAIEQESRPALLRSYPELALRILEDGSLSA